jgi:hypothetical protein
MNKNNIINILTENNINFDSINEYNNFIIYCDYMMFSNHTNNNYPDIDYKYYFRQLYKFVENSYEQKILEEHYNNSSR